MLDLFPLVFPDQSLPFFQPISDGMKFAAEDTCDLIHNCIALDPMMDIYKVFTYPEESNQNGKLLRAINTALGSNLLDFIANTVLDN